MLRQLARLFRVERGALRGEARQAHREHDTRLQHAIVGGGGRRRAGGQRDGDRVLGLGARQRVQRPARAGAALLHQLAIQRFRRGIRREVELAAQHGAQQLVLAQRLRVAAGARVAGHELAVRTLGEGLEREQPGERLDLAVRVVAVAAEHGKPGRGGRKVAPQRAPLCGGPLLEAA